jgi:hypothetical protein
MLTPAANRGNQHAQWTIRKARRRASNPMKQRETDRLEVPRRTKDVWSIQTALQVEERARDLAALDLNIEGKLYGCHVISLKVEDIAPHGVTVDRAMVRESKTRHPLSLE